MIKEITEILNSADKIDNWSINLVKINVTKREGVKYYVEELSDFDENGILKTLKEIVQIYTNGEKASLYSDIEEYNSDTISNVIYKMDITNELIKDTYDLFISALSNPDRENDPIKNKYDCYVLKSSIEENGEDIPIKFIFMKNPIKVLKNKFIKLGEKYKEITDTVIGLELSIDMIAYGNTIYFFNNSGEKLFNMERAYKTVCKEKIEEIKDMGIVSDIESFMNVANSGHNPKKFISFNKENLRLLNDDKMKDNISAKFNIPLINGKFDTTNDEVSKKLIKLLCDKGKIDPFNNKPVEVAGAKEWK